MLVSAWSNYWSVGIDWRPSSQIQKHEGAVLMRFCFLLKLIFSPLCFWFFCCLTGAYKWYDCMCVLSKFSAGSDTQLKTLNTIKQMGWFSSTWLCLRIKVSFFIWLNSPPQSVVIQFTFLTCHLCILFLSCRFSPSWVLLSACLCCGEETVMALVVFNKSHLYIYMCFSSLLPISICCLRLTSLIHILRWKGYKPKIIPIPKCLNSKISTFLLANAKNPQIIFHIDALGSILYHNAATWLTFSNKYGEGNIHPVLL